MLILMVPLITNNEMLGLEFVGANESILIFFADAWSSMTAKILFRGLDYGFFSFSSGQAEPGAHGTH